MQRKEIYDYSSSSITKLGDNFVLPLSQEMVDKLGIQNGGEIKAATSADAIVLCPLQTGERGQEFQKLKSKARNAAEINTMQRNDY